MVKGNLTPEMDKRVNRILELIEENGDSFAQKAEMYYKKRPELISHVEEFYGMYKSLVERYDHLKGELRKNSSSTDLQSMGSGISDICMQPLPPTCPNPERKLGRRMSDGGSVRLSTFLPPEKNLGRRISGHRAAGFDFFLGSGGGSNDANKKEAYVSFTLTDSDPESDDSCVDNCFDFSSNSGDNALNLKIIELEIELRYARDELRSARDKLRSYEEVEVNHASAAQMGISDLQQEGMETIGTCSSLKEELRIAEERLEESERKANSLKTENDAASERILQLQNQVASAQNDIASLNSDREDLNEKVATLNVELCSRDNKMDEQDKHLNKLRNQQTELISWVESAHKQLKRLRSNVDELEKENERQRVLISEGAEEKREAIRQLCFSLEHYRNGYNKLRQAFTETSCSFRLLTA